MTWRLGEYWKSYSMPESNKAPFQTDNMCISCPVRTIKRKNMNQGYEVKYCSPSSSKHKLNLFAK